MAKVVLFDLDQTLIDFLRMKKEASKKAANSFLPFMPRPQYVHPWQFGHGETKKTGLWLRGLPMLTPTNVVSGREQRIWKMAPSADRAKIRRLTHRRFIDIVAELDLYTLITSKIISKGFSLQVVVIFCHIN